MPLFKRVNSQSPDDDPTSIGNLLIEMKLITREQLRDALDRIETDLLGESLVKLELITETQLELALARQRMLRGERLQPQAVLTMVDKAQTEQRRVFDGLAELGSLASMAAKQGGKP